MINGQELKQIGLDLVSSHNPAWLGRMRTHARHCARTYGAVSADDIRVFAEQTNDHPAHGNCYGAVFRGREWRCIGRKRSAIASNHAREIRIWALTAS